VVAGTPDNGDPDPPRREALQARPPGRLDGLEGDRATDLRREPDPLVDGEDLDGQACDRGRRELGAARRPVEPLDGLDLGEGRRHPPPTALLGRRIEGRDGPLVEVGVEGIDEDEADDLRAVAGGEHASVDGSEGVGDDDEGRPLAGFGQGRTQVGCRVGDGVTAARVGAAEPGPVVDTGSPPVRRRRKDEPPGTGAGTDPALEDNGRGVWRRRRPPTVEVDGPTVGEGDPAAEGLVRWATPAKGEPGLWTADPGHVESQAEHGAETDGAHDGSREPNADTTQSLADRRHRRYGTAMCRSIKPLRRPGAAVTTEEVEAAARQYVRKVSGIRTPSSRREAAFEAAVAEIAASTARLLEALGVQPIAASGGGRD